MLGTQPVGVGARHLERLLIALSGALAIWLGHRVFLDMPLAEKGPDGQLLSSISTGSQSFDGVFNGRLSDTTGTLPARTVLRRQGDRVTGVYSYGVGQGEISGIVEEDTLLFVWQSGGSHGGARIGRARAAWSSTGPGATATRRSAGARGPALDKVGEGAGVAGGGARSESPWSARVAEAPRGGHQLTIRNWSVAAGVRPRAATDFMTWHCHRGRAVGGGVQ